MSDVRRVQVVKRDGSKEPFEFAKLRRSVAAAMRTCHYEDRYADALCRAVTLHIDQSARRHPTTEYVFRCVRAVLSETGLTDVGEQFALFRRRRDSQRRDLCVIGARRAQGRTVPWDRGRVTRTLEKRYGVGHATARIVSGEIERRVLGLGYKTLTAALVSELLRSELRAWGIVPETAIGRAREALPAAATRRAPSSPE